MLPIFCLLGIAFGISQIIVAFLGIEYHLGTAVAALVVSVALVFRFTLASTVGAFFGALNVLEWHWVYAGLFAAPGLLFAIPGTLAVLVTGIKNKF